MGGVERACEVCGHGAAAEFCEGCALCYCGGCSARRHAKGAFTRHCRVELPRRGGEAEKEPWGGESVEGSGEERRSMSDADATVCDECGDRGRRAAEVECTACELRLCAACADDVHRAGSMQLHVTDGSLRNIKRREQEDAKDDEENESDSSESRHVAQLTKLLQDDGVDESSRVSSKQATSPFFAPVVAFDGEADQDPDQEMSPTPPTKSASSSADPSYDLWGPWSVRAFKNSGEKSDGDQWRGLRSLSIDDGPSSPPATLNEDDLVPLSSITKSLRSLSFASESDDFQPTTGKRTLRPRSHSDYTSLGSVKLNDIWGEHIPQLHEEKVSSTPLGAKQSGARELVDTMETAVASRHVIIRADRGGFDAVSLKEVIEALQVFGAIASLRNEFASDGVLFCTFFELKAAIGAVKLWFTNCVTTLSIRTSACFSLPYETPNDVNCATVLVQLHGVMLSGTFSDMRQICSRFGEVASVLERECEDLQTRSNQYIVEFNDSRDVNNAMAHLSGSILPNGLLVTVSRFHPPTLDAAKVHVFNEALLKQHGKSITRLPNRPKSYSESTTIVTSPSSTSSSPLNGPSGAGGGRGEENLSDVAFNDSRSPELNSASPPFMPSLRLSSDTWRVREPARPRSSSAFASLSSGSSEPLLSEKDFPTGAFMVPPSTFSTQYRAKESSSPPFSHPPPLNPRPAALRSGSDPGFRHVSHNYASSNAGSTTSSLGRNDQGTGEFTLSIEKVISGEDSRTTLMIRNIPNKYTQQMLLAEINVNHHGKYDFFYLPIDFKNKCNMGYAFINFIETDSIVPFYQEFDSQKWTNFNSEKVCAISYARLQGKQAMITRFQNSSLLEKHESYRPLVFYSSGPNRGKPEPFPTPKPHQGHYVNRKPHHHHHQHAYVVSQSDEYLLMQTSHLYAQQQQLQHAANVLHGHALLANAHAAAAAMLHTMPNLGISSQYPPSRSFQCEPTYHHQHSSDRRYATASPYTTSVMSLPRVSGTPAYGGYTANSPFSPASS